VPKPFFKSLKCSLPAYYIVIAVVVSLVYLNARIGSTNMVQLMNCAVSEPYAGWPRKGVVNRDPRTSSERPSTRL